MLLKDKYGSQHIFFLGLHFVVIISVIKKKIES